MKDETMIGKCDICGESMPEGETMFKFHGYSGPCPKPPLLKPHQQRVVDEKTELDSKIDKLCVFISKPLFSTLLEEEQERLKRQFHHMRQYSVVLKERVAAFQ